MMQIRPPHRILETRILSIIYNLVTEVFVRELRLSNTSFYVHNNYKAQF